MADTLRDLLYGAALRGQVPAAPLPLPDTIQRLAMQQGGSVGTPYRGTLAEMVGRGGTMAQRLAQALDQYGARIPGTQTRISLKDLTLGDAGQVLENTSYGMPPTTGGNYATGGLGTIGASPQAMELFNLGGVAGGAAQAGKTGARVLGPTLKEMVREGGEKYMRGIGAQQDLITWHGSPHTFDRFDSSKIGTGEGAQSYGHGLYLAESPAVAQEYKTALSGAKLADGSIVKPDWTDPTFLPINELRKANGDIAKARAAVVRQSGDWPEQIAAFDDLVRRGVSLDTGSLYKVDLPDSMIERMLDWDKPLSAQPMNVLDALSNTRNKQLRAIVDYANSPYSFAELSGETKTMGEAIKLLGMNTSPARGSQMLAKQKIPGIRYLDGGSRADGAGTANFVIFPGEENALTILERNGVPLQRR